MRAMPVQSGRDVAFIVKGEACLVALLSTELRSTDRAWAAWAKRGP